MAIDIGWAQAPDALQGATGFPAAQGGVLYVFPGHQLGESSIPIGSAAMDDTPRQIDIVECHVHVRNDTVDTIHVTWVLEQPGGPQAKYWQWFRCTPGGSATLTNAAGAAGFRQANPDLDVAQWLPNGVEVEDGVSVIDEHTQAYSIMLATELAATMVIDDPNQGPAVPRGAHGMPVGWGLADDVIGGAQGQLVGSDVVWVYAAPTAKAGGYTVTGCSLWMSPNQPWACQVSYQLADSLPIDVVHYFTLDRDAGTAARNGQSLSADGSAAPAGATAASDELWGTSDPIAAWAATSVRPA